MDLTVDEVVDNFIHNGDITAALTLQGMALQDEAPPQPEWYTNDDNFAGLQQEDVP